MTIAPNNIFDLAASLQLPEPTGEIGSDTAKIVNSADQECRVVNLFQAIEADDVAALERLISADHFVDVRDEKGRTPLMIAAVRGHHATYRTLLNAGASLDVLDAAGVSAIEYVNAFGAMTHEHIRIMKATMMKSFMLGFARSKKREDGAK